MVFSQNIYFTLIIFLNKNATEDDVEEVICVLVRALY